MKRIFLGVITLIALGANVHVQAMEQGQDQDPPVFIGNVVVPVCSHYIANQAVCINDAYQNEISQILYMNSAHAMVCYGQCDQAKQIFNILKESPFPPVNLAAKNWLIYLKLRDDWKQDIATGAEFLRAIMQQPESPLVRLANLAVERK